MNRWDWRHAVVFAVLATCGACTAGRNFQEPSEESLVLGTTTIFEIRERFGKPRGEGSTTRNGCSMKTLTYAYARHRDLGGAHAFGVVPARGITFTFFEDRLVGHSFVSSFEEDHTDFDESKLVQIQQGSSKRPDVVALLGPPRGRCIYPMSADKGQEGVLYGYTQLYKALFKTKIYTKTAVITFDANGVVSKVESQVSGEK
jgi:hypothetical protein